MRIPADITMLSGRAFGLVPGKLVVQALNAALRATSVSPRLFLTSCCILLPHMVTIHVILGY